MNTLIFTKGRYVQNNGRLFGGVDVNANRINLVVVDEGGELRGTYTFWFREVAARGYPKRRPLTNSREST